MDHNNCSFHKTSTIWYTVHCIYNLYKSKKDSGFDNTCKWLTKGVVQNSQKAISICQFVKSKKQI